MNNDLKYTSKLGEEITVSDRHRSQASSGIQW